jgi:hypothetical protein
VPLRNFGLSFSSRGARPNIGWRPRHAAGIGFVLVLVLLAALWAMLAHAASEHRLAPISNRQVANSALMSGELVEVT